MPRPGSVQMPHIPSGELTDRHFDIIALVAEGLSNDEIAAKLGIAEQTVSSHMKTIFKRTGATNRAHLTTLAYKMGAVVAPKSARVFRPMTKSEEDMIARKIYRAMMPALAETTHWNQLSSAARERCRSAARVAVQVRAEQLRLPIDVAS